MRVRPALLLAAFCVTAIAGCGGREEPSTPVACLEGQGAYLRALAAAPAEVRLDGETPIADCLAENQQGGDLATVGEAMIEAATQLNTEARTEPTGPAALRLGYLLGAAERGSEQTAGIHAELIRRLAVAARYSPEGPLPQAFAAAYHEGFDAGRASG